MGLKYFCQVPQVDTSSEMIPDGLIEWQHDHDSPLGQGQGKKTMEHCKETWEIIFVINLLWKNIHVASLVCVF